MPTTIRHNHDVRRPPTKKSEAMSSCQSHSMGAGSVSARRLHRSVPRNAISHWQRTRKYRGGPTTRWSGRAATGSHTFRAQPPEPHTSTGKSPPNDRVANRRRCQTHSRQACPEAVQAWHRPGFHRCSPVRSGVVAIVFPSSSRDNNPWLASHQVPVRYQESAIADGHPRSAERVWVDSLCVELLPR
jgi:hypothetical protein